MPLSQPRSASGKLASRIGSKEKRRVAALRERRLRVARELPQQSKIRFRKQRQRAWVLAEQIALKPERIGLAARAHWPCGPSALALRPCARAEWQDAFAPGQTRATFAAQVSERQAGESNWLEREATRSSATRAAIESQVGRQIAAQHQRLAPFGRTAPTN